MSTRLLALISLFLLTGCISTTDGLAQPTALCAPPGADSQPEAAADLYFVTTRLADCGGATIAFGRLRARSPGFGYFAGAGPLLVEREAWLARLRAQLPAQGGPVLLYVHGYNNSFRDAIDRAKRLRDLSAFGGPVIAFSWPSQARVSRYGWDEENALWTQPYFDDLLLALIREPKVSEVVLVAHSMGNRIALRSLFEAERAEPSLAAAEIRKVILASPDVDRAIFERDYLTMLGRGLRRTTIYASRVDRALRASWAVHGYVRVGDSGCRFVDVLRGRHRRRCFSASDPPPVPPPNVVVLETSLVRGSLLGHSDFVENAIVRADLCRVLKGDRQFYEREPAGDPLTNVFFLVRPRTQPPPCPPRPEAAGRASSSE